MAINVGDPVPEGTLTRMGKERPEPVTTDALFKGRKVVFFAVPGAFTPTWRDQASARLSARCGRHPERRRRCDRLHGGQ